MEIFAKFTPFTISKICKLLYTIRGDKNGNEK